MVIGGEISRRIEDLSMGDPACFIFKREEDQFSVVIPYILTGLARGEKVCYAADSRNREQILKQLKQENPDADECLKKGQLIISSVQCAEKSKPDANGLFSFIQEETEAALAEGYSALRIIVEMDWCCGLQNFEMQLKELAGASDFISHGSCLTLFIFS